MYRLPGRVLVAGRLIDSGTEQTRMRLSAARLALGAAMRCAVRRLLVGRGRSPSPTVRIGSDGFYESKLVAEIYAQVLEADGYTVTRNSASAPARSRQPALERGQIDLCPSTSAPASATTTRRRRPATAEPTGRPSRRSPDKAEGGITVFAISPGRGHERRRRPPGHRRPARSLTKMSDLAAVQDDLKWGLPPDCDDEPAVQGRARVRTASRTRPPSARRSPPATRRSPRRSRTRPSTSPGSARRSRPSRSSASSGPRGRQEHPAGREHGPARPRRLPGEGGDEAAFQALLDAVSAKLTTEELTELGVKVAVDQEDAEDVAKEWLTAKALLTVASPSPHRLEAPGTARGLRDFPGCADASGAGPVATSSAGGAASATSGSGAGARPRPARGAGRGPSANAIAPPMRGHATSTTWTSTAMREGVGRRDADRRADRDRRQLERADVAGPGRDRRRQVDARREQRRLADRRLDADGLARRREREDRAAPGEQRSARSASTSVRGLAATAQPVAQPREHSRTCGQRSRPWRSAPRPAAGGPRSRSRTTDDQQRGHREADEDRARRRSRAPTGRGSRPTRSRPRPRVSTTRSTTIVPRIVERRRPRGRRGRGSAPARRAARAGRCWRDSRRAGTRACCMYGTARDRREQHAASGAPGAAMSTHDERDQHDDPAPVGRAEDLGGRRQVDGPEDERTARRCEIADADRRRGRGRRGHRHQPPAARSRAGRAVELRRRGGARSGGGRTERRRAASTGRRRRSA